MAAARSLVLTIVFSWGIVRGTQRQERAQMTQSMRTFRENNWVLCLLPAKVLASHDSSTPTPPCA